MGLFPPALELFLERSRAALLQVGVQEVFGFFSLQNLTAELFKRMWWQTLCYRLRCEGEVHNKNYQKEPYR